MKKKYKIVLNAPVVLGFVFICTVATILGIITGGYLTQLIFMTYHSSLANPMTYVHFFTHVFGHSGWEHLLSNASYLLLLGPMLEEKYGHKAIIEIIVVTSVITGLINYIFFWKVGLCGASGVVFAFILLASFTGFKEGEIPLTFIMVAIIFMGQQVYDGISVRDDVSNMAHIVGGLIGGMAGYALNKKSQFGS